MFDEGTIWMAMAALGIGSLVTIGATRARAAAAYIVRSRSESPAEVFLDKRDGRQEFTEEDLYGLGHVPWTLWGIISAFAGAVLAYVLVGELSPTVAIWGVAGILIPRLVRAYLICRRQSDINRQVHDLVSLLWRALALGSELDPALHEIARLLRPGVVRERLQYHLEQSNAIDPIHAIERLARDIRSAELDSLALGVRAVWTGRSRCQQIPFWSPGISVCCCSQSTYRELTLADLALSAVRPWQVLRVTGRHPPPKWLRTDPCHRWIPTAPITPLLIPQPYPKVEPASASWYDGASLYLVRPSDLTTGGASDNR